MRTPLGQLPGRGTGPRRDPLRRPAPFHPTRRLAGQARGAGPGRDLVGRPAGRARPVPGRGGAAAGARQPDRPALEAPVLPALPARRLRGAGQPHADLGERAVRAPSPGPGGLPDQVGLPGEAQARGERGVERAVRRRSEPRVGAPGHDRGAWCVRGRHGLASDVGRVHAGRVCRGRGRASRGAATTGGGGGPGGESRISPGDPRPRVRAGARGAGALAGDGRRARLATGAGPPPSRSGGLRRASRRSPSHGAASASTATPRRTGGWRHGDGRTATCTTGKPRHGCRSGVRAGRSTAASRRDSAGATRRWWWRIPTGASS